MNRRKKSRSVVPQRWVPQYQVPVVKDRSGDVIHSSALAVTAESNQVTSLEVMSVDENLLDRACTQWQFGDWDSLRQIDLNLLQHHPDRAKLALLAAAGHYHVQNNNSTRRLILMAKVWGCSKLLISQMLISGVHNILGRVAAVSGKVPRALGHFELALDTGAPLSDRLIKQVRIAMQLQQLGIALPLNLIECGQRISSQSTFAY